MSVLGSVTNNHLEFFVSLKEKQDKPLMTPSYPSNGLKDLRLVDPTKLSSPRSQSGFFPPPTKSSKPAN